MPVKILIGFAIVLVVLVIVIATRAADFRITRSAPISAPASAVFDQVNNLHNWEKWSPWAKMDPAMEVEYSGPTSGVGASQTWAGNNQVGSGRMTIVESKPGERVRVKLEFQKPMAATNEAVFTFKPDGSGTLVTWDMTGRNGFPAKAFGLVMNMDKLVGGQFEQGLSNLRAVVEAK